MTLKKILVVDDDPHIRELVTVFLENEDFHALKQKTENRDLNVLSRKMRA
ncbi:hypothetical protein NBRC111894_3051 [Sporolactobacillus inulinus]|uniref:Uncharacterized protein n=1 Tax=Sporolactobacillus inulinus TaxID=2078 RepID=A0A4Y1ZEF8_9BACL|nr:hypothetical protein NBRC111894_3051 [Sporolactobacillus inulinus]